jgi:protease IV
MLFMSRRIATALALIVLSGCIAGQGLGNSTSTRPDQTGAPASANSTAIAPATQPADTTAKPVVATASSSSFPTPAELIAKLKATEQKQDALPKVAFFDLGLPLAEKPADFSLFGDTDDVLTLRALIDRLEQARQDKDIRGVLLAVGGSEMNLSQAMELRAELDALRKDGKRTFVYADSYDTTSYIAACGATDVCMLEGGDIEIPGVGFETMFAKGLLDKVGVDADYVQIGEYKGADEEFTRTEASPELRGELNKLADSLYEQIVDAISTSRKIPRADVVKLVDESLIPGNEAKKSGLVDHLVDMDSLRTLMADQLGKKVNLLRHYGEAPKDQVDLSSPFAFFALLSKKQAAPTRDGVAVIYAEGVIVDGEAQTSLFSQSDSIGSDDIRQAVRAADKDDKIKAVVLRIDSPGGSALASEVMWQSVRRLAKEKPVIISVGSMAASGGYYLASSGDYIFADSTAIVGSIGVVGGKFVLKDLFDKLGLNTESFLRGANADLFSESTEWTPEQRAQVTAWMRQTYDQFTDRVMTTRSGKIKAIDAVARGRIFSAKQAKELGMVDQIGGVQDAIEYAARKADLRAGEYDVRVIPAPKSFADIFNQTSSDTDDDDTDSRTPIRPTIQTGGELAELMSILPAPIRRAAMEQLQIMLLLQERPIVLASPYVLIVK